MDTATTCATSFGNWYCPVGSIYPTKCPIGQFVETASTVCSPCPIGKYCWPAADNSHDGIVGDCDHDDGYLCRSGAFSPRPLIEGLDYIQAGSNQFLSYNGPVMGGYYTSAATPGVANAC